MMNEKFDELVSRLIKAHGEEMVSVIIHGSALVTGQAALPADYRLMVVTKTLSADVLRQSQPVVRWWAGSQPPVYFTESEFNDSLDVFPIEFRQMKRAYRVLYGRDLLAGAEISPASLRWQIEHELRGKLLRLRGLYLPASESAGSLMILMTDSVVSFIQLFRPTLELLGEEPPQDRFEVLRRTGERLNFNPAPLERVLRLRQEPVRLMEPEVEDLFADYLNCLSRVIAAVDRIK
ncbi:MAG TPA: hypothetical protein VFD58_31110 [Blastocatellia bacterium]|nr:hypothetical protein [Blastocatellia bacterium]